MTDIPRADAPPAVNRSETTRYSEAFEAQATVLELGDGKGTTPCPDLV
jgi:hypothetical protein